MENLKNCPLVQVSHDVVSNFQWGGGLGFPSPPSALKTHSPLQNLPSQTRQKRYALFFKNKSTQNTHKKYFLFYQKNYYFPSCFVYENWRFYF